MRDDKKPAKLTPSEDAFLADTLLDVEEMMERGEDPSPLLLCRDFPHLLSEMAHRLRALRATRWLSQPVVPDPVPAASPDEQLAGRVLSGRYRLEHLLAEGGFARVWRATDLKLNRQVALKVSKMDRPGHAESLMAEARRVAALKHPGIVPVHDVGQEGNIWYIVSELIEGGSLDRLISARPFPVLRVLNWVIEVAEALDYAHRMAVVHCDIKPGNILIDHHGRALLGDFGIARPLGNQSGGGTDRSLYGTMRYMAPEQLAGQMATPQSDIHALGMVLHELLVAKNPRTIPQDTTPPVTQPTIPGRDGPLYADLPNPLRAICAQALNPDSSKRHASAAVLAQDLRQAIKSRLRSGLTAGLMAVGALLALGAFSFILSGKNQNPGEHGSGDRKATEATWLAETRKLPAESQVRAVIEALKARNPGFDGAVEGTIDHGTLWQIKICTDKVHDITPLQALDTLTHVELCGTFGIIANGMLKDIKPLRDLKLKTLICKYNIGLKDLTPLKGMPLETLDLWRTGVDDLEAIRGFPLRILGISFCEVHTLEPLRGMGLFSLFCNHCPISDLGPLIGMPLEDLRCHDTRISSLETVRGMNLYALECQRTQVSSLEPLRGMNHLKVLNCFLCPVTDISPLAECSNLKILYTSHEFKRDNAAFKWPSGLPQWNDNSIANNNNR